MQEYLNKIKIFSSEENRIVNSDLENLISQALKHPKFYFTVDELIQKSADHIITINMEIADQVVNHIGLLLSEENEEGNLCFANSNKLRSEFRQSFTILNLLDFSYAILHSSIYERNLKNENQKISVPSDSDLFWRIVQMGVNFRKKENS